MIRITRPEGSHPAMVDRPFGDLPILRNYPLDYPSDSKYITAHREPERTAHMEEEANLKEKNVRELQHLVEKLTSPDTSTGKNT